MNFPQQVLLSQKGMLVFSGAFVVIVFIIVAISMFQKDKPGTFTLLIASSLCFIFALMGFEEMMGNVYYIRMHGVYIQLMYFLFIFLLVQVLYGLAISLGWTYYQYKVKGKITPLMWELISFVDEMKKELKL